MFRRCSSLSHEEWPGLGFDGDLAPLHLGNFIALLSSQYE